MPSNRKQINFRLAPEDEHLVVKLEELATSNRRTFTDEIKHAIERHLAQPPRLDVPPMVPAPPIKPPPEAIPIEKRPRGRPRKAAGTPTSPADSPVSQAGADSPPEARHATEGKPGGGKGGRKKEPSKRKEG